MTLKPARDLLRLLVERFVATRCAQVAGALAFTTLLAIVPLLTVVITLFGNFPGFASLGDSLRMFLLDNLLPERAGRIIATYAFQFSQKAAGLTVIGVVLLVVTALMLLLTIDRVFNHIWGVRRPRPLLTRLTVHWFALTLGPLALGASALATGHLVATSVALAGEGSVFGTLSARVFPPLLLCALFSFLYFAVPNHAVRALHALAGGVVAALIFVLMQRAFGLFLARIPTYTLVYGTFAALPIFLVWLYLSWVVVLLGATLSATLPGFLERRTMLDAFPGDRACAAIAALVSLAQAQRDGQSLAFDRLQACARLSSGDTETLLGEMCEAGWAARTEDGRWLLRRPAGEIRISAVVRRLALASDSWQSACAGEAPLEEVAMRLEQALRSADLPISELLVPPGERKDRRYDQIG